MYSSLVVVYNGGQNKRFIKVAKNSQTANSTAYSQRTIKESDTMDTMSQEDLRRFKQEIMRQVDFVLDSNLEHLRRMDRTKRVDLWDQISGNQDTFESEFIMKTPYA